jgi:hypothetical protein
MSKLVKQIDAYDIWKDVDATGTCYTVNDETGGQTRLVGSYQTLKQAIKAIDAEAVERFFDCHPAD